MKSRIVTCLLLTALAAIVFASLPLAAQPADAPPRGEQARPQRMQDQRQRDERRDDRRADKPRRGPEDRGGPRDFTAGPMPGPMGELMAALRDVELTPEQRQDIRKTTRDHREAVRQWREDNAEALDDLHDRMRAHWREHADAIAEMRDLHRDMDELLRSDKSTEAITGDLDKLRTRWSALRDEVKTDAQPLRDQWRELHADAPSPRQWLDQVLETLTEQQRRQVAEPVKAIRERMDKMAEAPFEPLGPGMRAPMRGDDARGPRRDDRQRPMGDPRGREDRPEQPRGGR